MKQCSMSSVVLTKTTVAQIEVALSYHSVRGLYFLAVVLLRLYNDKIFVVQLNLVQGDGVTLER